MKKEKKDKNFLNKPFYLGGVKAMREFISKELKYPKEALELRKEGTVRIRYEIDYKGNVVDTIVLSSVGYGCDEEAIRIVKKLKFQVEKIRKMRVSFHKTIQINFRLPIEKPKAKVKPKTPTIKKIQYTYTTSALGAATTKQVYTYTITKK